MLPGYEVRILDGHHLAGTEHRLKPLRRTRAGALPGQSLVALDPQRQLIRHVHCCEDGHTQERALVDERSGLGRTGAGMGGGPELCHDPLDFWGGGAWRPRGGARTCLDAALGGGGPVQVAGRCETGSVSGTGVADCRRAGRGAAAAPDHPASWTAPRRRGTG